jgi:hypothetical protein
MIGLVIILALSSEPDLPAGVTCDQVRALVAEHGKPRALAWALRHGYSWKQIREARRCL